MAVERVPHILKPLRGQSQPTRLVCFAVDPLIREVEKKTTEHAFRCVAASVSYLYRGEVVDREWKVSCRIDDFWSWLAGVLCRDRTTWCASYQLGYSLTLLDFWDGGLGKTARWLWGILEDPPSVVEVCCGRRKVRFVDLTNYWRVPLQELLGADRVPELGNRDPSPPLIDAFDRARARVRVIEECLCATIKMLASTGMGSLRCTAASTAWGVWRRSYYRSPLWVHANQDVLSLERQALFGGELTVLKPGLVSSPTVALDVNSLYPWVMATQDLPVKMIDCSQSAAIANVGSILNSDWACADVAVQPMFPLPKRSSDGKVVYSDLPGDYYLCGETLRLHAAAGAISRVRQLCRYATGPLLGPFALDLYRRKVDAKRSGDLAGSLLFKMLLNSLSGKFAQKRRFWHNAPDVPCRGRWGYWWIAGFGDRQATRYRAVAGSAQRLEEGGETSESCPSVAAAITSAGRLRLRQLVDMAWAENCSYLDTDCLHVNGGGEAWLRAHDELSPEILGKLKVVARGQDAYYWNPKFYRVGDYWVSNVIQPTAKEIADGLYVQESRSGIQKVLSGLQTDTVKVKLREVQVRTGPGAYRPTLSKRSTENGQTKKGDP